MDLYCGMHYIFPYVLKVQNVKNEEFFYTLLISSSLPHNREEDENIITFPHACWNEIKHLCLTYNTSWEFEKALDHPMTMISVITARIIGRNFNPQVEFLNWNMLKKYSEMWYIAFHRKGYTVNFEIWYQNF